MRHLRGFLLCSRKAQAMAPPATVRNSQSVFLTVGEKYLTKRAFYGILPPVKKKPLQEVCYAWFSLGAK